MVATFRVYKAASEALLCLQVVDLGEMGPVRCARCKAYMNAYMRWTDGGKTFVCNFCGHSNTCPDAYFCYLGPDNRCASSPTLCLSHRCLWQVALQWQTTLHRTVSVLTSFRSQAAHTYAPFWYTLLLAQIPGPQVIVLSSAFLLCVP